MARYRLKASMPAILNKPRGQQVSVILPVGAILDDSSQPLSTLLGMIGVYWEGRHYSVYPKDLIRSAERVSTEGA
jgi:hypothetical protein